MYKFICVCVYLYMQREGPERIYAELFTVIASGGWHWRAGAMWVYVSWLVYCAFISVLFEFFYRYVLFL